MAGREADWLAGAPADPQSLGEREQLSGQGWRAGMQRVRGPVGVHGPEHMVSTSRGQETSPPPPPRARGCVCKRNPQGTAMEGSWRAPSLQEPKTPL